MRPWQHVLEPLAGSLALAETLWFKPQLASPFNFGPPPHEAATVREVVEMAVNAYGKGEVTWGDGSRGPHEAGLLKLEIAKAQATLGFQPVWSLPEAVERTVLWYKRQSSGEDARRLCEADMEDFCFFSPQRTQRNTEGKTFCTLDTTNDF